MGDSQRRTWDDISFHAADRGKSLLAFSRLTYAHCQCEHHRRALETTPRDCNENLLSATPGAYGPSPWASGAAPGLNMSNPASDQIRRKNGIFHIYGTYEIILFMKQESIRTTVDIPAPLYRKLKEQAAGTGSSIRELVLLGVRRVV